MSHRIVSTLCAGILLLGLVSSAEAALLGRLPVTPGGLDFQAYYDDHLDITWLADANLAASNTFGLPTDTNLGPHPSGRSFGFDAVVSADGLMTWPGALFWFDAMNASNYLGFNDWRFPTTLEPDTSCAPAAFQPQGSGCLGSEMGHLWYTELSNNIGGNWPNNNNGPFSNVILARAGGGNRWSTESTGGPVGAAWSFSTRHGRQALFPKDDELSSWAVRSGDSFAPAVPAPSAMLLFGTGLVGLVGWRHWRVNTLSNRR